MSPTSDEHKLAAGTVLDHRYRIIAPIKAGGMGAVYRAVDIELGEKTCAIKEMLDQFETPSDRQAGIDRFLSEVQVMEDLAHGNIPRVTDHFLEKNNFYFVMEFIEGTDLSTLLKEQGPIAWERVVEWGVQVCDALSYTHGLKEPIVHRDLKPSNLMLRHADGRILVVDFGIARVTNPGPNMWIGTKEYAPPEQQLGKRDPRSDLFALGVSLHELITGRKPKCGEFVTELNFTDEEKRTLPPRLCETLLLAAQLFPEDRFQTAEAMRDALIEVLGYTPHVETNHAFAFTEAVQRLKDQAIDPPLRQLISRYGNECHTPHLPRQLERLVFTLGAETPFQLIIQLNEPSATIDFFERQGILSAVTLGAVAPAADDAADRARALIDRFVRDYESFKNTGWQLF